MEWTIGELAERASAALSPAARLNGRVRDVPNERLIRWYSTIGLLDPPSARRGRVALYGRRHLLQLLAVKRRQADGLTIAEIQAELAGATDQALESLVRVTEIARGTESPAEAATPRTPRPRFWAETPSVTAETGPAAPKPAPPLPITPRTGTAAPQPATPQSAAAPQSAAPQPAAASQPAATSRPAVPAAAIVHGVRLADGVTLLLDGGGRTPSPDDLAEIAAASEALLSVLRKNDLAPPEGKLS
ncbi:MerR family transcriptional regulator [Streptosporangium sp. CA-135522]|uniref:helix-turn-helix domain-containing protein n=1 Tax=Streptosporangium sp. CA-135522 TaxID=3240072 RepID=UPI003D935A0F